MLIWVIGLIITIPWAERFKAVFLNPDVDDTITSLISNDHMLPFCQEVWESKISEVSFFITVHVFGCFLLPFSLITLFSSLLWKNVVRARKAFCNSSVNFIAASSTIVENIHWQRKLRVLKMFTGVVFAFFICWIPLYIIGTRIKYLSTVKGTQGSQEEQTLLSFLFPVAQLLGSCNSCVNPVLYAFLNQRFRKCCESIFKCTWCYTTESIGTFAGHVTKTGLFRRAKESKQSSNV